MTRDEFENLKPGDRIGHSDFIGAMHATVIRHGELISFARDDGTCSVWKFAHKFDDEWVMATMLLPHEPTAKEQHLAERVEVLERALTELMITCDAIWARHRYVDGESRVNARQVLAKHAGEPWGAGTYNAATKGTTE